MKRVGRLSRCTIGRPLLLSLRPDTILVRTTPCRLHVFVNCSLSAVFTLEDDVIRLCQHWSAKSIEPTVLVCSKQHDLYLLPLGLSDAVTQPQVSKRPFLLSRSSAVCRIQDVCCLTSFGRFGTVAVSKERNSRKNEIILSILSPDDSQVSITTRKWRCKYSPTVSLSLCKTGHKFGQEIELPLNLRLAAEFFTALFGSSRFQASEFGRATYCAVDHCWSRSCFYWAVRLEKFYMGPCHQTEHQAYCCLCMSLCKTFK